jgi:hypothetical protein
MKVGGHVTTTPISDRNKSPASLVAPSAAKANYYAAIDNLDMVA